MHEQRSVSWNVPIHTSLTERILMDMWLVDGWTWGWGTPRHVPRWKLGKVHIPTNVAVDLGPPCPSPPPTVPRQYAMRQVYVVKLQNCIFILIRQLFGNNGNYNDADTCTSGPFPVYKKLWPSYGPIKIVYQLHSGGNSRKAVTRLAFWTKNVHVAAPMGTVHPIDQIELWRRHSSLLLVLTSCQIHLVRSENQCWPRSI